MPQIQSMQTAIPTTANRKVWVLNRHYEAYTEKFRGRTITVPPEEEKELLMPYLEACRFLGQPKAPAVKNIDGSYKTSPKALYILELNKKEVEEIEGKSLKDLARQAKQDEEKVTNICPICPNGRSFASLKGLNTHMTRMHPDREPIAEK